MVYKLKPLELSIDFEDREYELGDRIDSQVELAPNGDVDVREARVELVCEERYAQTYAAAGHSGSSPGAFGTRVVVQRSIQAVDERTDTYVHSSAVFLKETTLRSGRPEAHRVGLRNRASASATLRGG